MTCMLPEFTTVFERHERKFPITASLWGKAKALAERFAPAERFDGIHDVVHVRTTYLDTPNMDSYREYVERAPIRRKIRLRQYGYNGSMNGACWLEIKVKHLDLSLKRRIRAEMDQVVALLSGQDIAAHVAEQNVDVPHAPRTYQLIREAIVEGEMRPVVRVDYERLAFQESNGDRVRITLDRDIRFWTIGRPEVGYGEVVLEMKFGNEAPGWMPTLLEALSIRQTSRFSKYARAVHALGLNGHG